MTPDRIRPADGRRIAEPLRPEPLPWRLGCFSNVAPYHGIADRIPVPLFRDQFGRPEISQDVSQAIVVHMTAPSRGQGRLHLGPRRSTGHHSEHLPVTFPVATVEEVRQLAPRDLPPLNQGLLCVSLAN